MCTDCVCATSFKSHQFRGDKSGKVFSNLPWNARVMSEDSYLGSDQLFGGQGGVEEYLSHVTDQGDRRKIEYI